MRINKTRYKLHPTSFFKERQEKDLIVLHFTAGRSVREAYNIFRDKDHISTHYIISRQGEIYELYSSHYWGYHLGMPYGNKDHWIDKRSIAIELVNVGPLRLDAKDKDQLNYWKPDNKYLKRYCSIDCKEKYIKYLYRGFYYYATFTEQQYISIAYLVNILCKEYDINKIFPNNPLETDIDRYKGFKGILSHQQFRSDKFDIGPAFDWDRFKKMLFQ